MNIPAYLTRIYYTGPTDPTVPTLFALQRAHLYAVPFENLDIHLGRPISLESPILFDKIVTRNRGGFCYELNGLFSLLLTALGYTVILLNARGVNDDGSYAREFDHLALQVTSPDDPATSWLVDVGWGNGPLEPLRMNEPGLQAQGDRLFRFLSEGEYLILAERIPFDAVEKGLAEDVPAPGASRWIKHYAFTLRPRTYTDFYDCCRYHSTSPDSFFARKRLCSLYLPDGRVTVSDLRLITTSAGVREERDLSGEEELTMVLKDLFEVDLYR
jgi:N-hydroxyarylamine O-acetyltransferase